MAEILLTAAIMKAIDVCNDLVGEEGSAFKNLRENIHWMERQLRHMQSYLEIAEAWKGHDRRAANLVEDIEELAGDVEDTLETFLPHVDSHLSFPCRIFPNFSAVHKFSVKIETIKKRIKDIDDDRKTYGITMDTTGSRGSQKWDARRAYLLLADEPEVMGLDEDCEQLEARLRDQRLDFGVVSIVGMPGLGKTTLAKKIFKNVQHCFQCSAMVYVSQGPKIRDLLGDIARQVGLTEEQIKKNPETNLYSFLQQRRYIILFDEIWDFESWDAIKYCIPTAKNGSRIIITSRNNCVGRYIGGQHSLHTLQPLDREKSWELFSKQITSSSFEKMTTLPEELKSVGEQIVEKCGGVPLAIVVTAGVLRARERSENEWKQVLNNIGQDDEDEWSRVLALSYEDLPTRLKHCFLYFGLFPEGYEIKALDLMNMWIAEKLVEQPSNEEEREIEDVAEGYLNNLIARNLIQVSRSKYNGKIKSCRIHDILRSSLCVKIGKKSKFCSVLGAKGARRVASNAKTITDNVKPNSETSKLRVLMCSSAEKHNGKEKELLKCISSFKLLRVLSLEFDRGCTLTCFPNEFWNLIHLTYFRLRVSYLIIPSGIRNLKNLLTLNIRGCGEVSIHPSFWKMKQLRHVLVDMENWRYKGTNRDRSIISSTSVSLENLRTLEWVSIEIIQLAGVHSLSRLRRLGIYSHFGQKIEQLFSSMPPLENLEKLSLSFIYPANIGGTLRLNLSGYHSLLKLRIKGCLFKLPNVDAFPPNLVKLCLFYTKMEEDPMKILKRLPKLKFLKLIDGYGGLSVMDFSGAGSFPQLQVLHIQFFNKLRELISDEELGMPNLKKVILRDCPNVVRITGRIQFLIGMSHWFSTSALFKEIQ